MANRILKGLAVAAGTGLAMGVTSGRARGRSISDQEDDVLYIEPLLDRLERVEARIETFDRHRSVDDYSTVIADLDRRVEENTRALTLLRESINSVEQKVRATKEEIPAFVERSVTTRFEDLRSRFDTEIARAQQRTLETFERAIDEKISARIGAIEKKLEEQAGSIDALRVRAEETDSNLQKLVTAIEKLCERAQLIAPEPEPPMRLPFEAQFQDAMNREPVVPRIRTAEVEKLEAQLRVPAFASMDVEPEKPKKSRFFFRKLVVAGFSLLGSRFFLK